MTDLLLEILGVALALGGFFTLTLAPCILALTSEKI